ncbi:MAG: hypothetical protein CSYNP_02633 [Syntrophus sp. SKADARSKE-3]|nr:hypothetical protein [Syntrophus sp. SKADARSKE-3]
MKHYVLNYFNLFLERNTSCRDMFRFKSTFCSVPVFFLIAIFSISFIPDAHVNNDFSLLDVSQYDEYSCETVNEDYRAAVYSHRRCEKFRSRGHNQTSIAKLNSDFSSTLPYVCKTAPIAVQWEHNPLTSAPIRA